MRRTALSLAALGLAAASCGVLPDGHALPQSLGRSLQRAVNGVHSITRSVESGSRRLATLPAKVAAIPDAAARGLRQLQGTGERFVANGQVRLQRAVPRIGQNLGALGESGIGRTRALAGKPAQIAGGQSHQPLDQFLGHAVTHRHRRRDGHAALARRSVGGAHQRIGHLIHVGVRHEGVVVAQP